MPKVNKRLLEIAGIRVVDGIRGEFIGGLIMGGLSLMGKAATGVGGALGMGGGAALPTSAAQAAATAPGATQGFVGGVMASGVGGNAAMVASGSGGMGIANAMGVAGMGMQAIQAFGGGMSGGGAITTKLPLSKEDKENQKIAAELSEEKWKEAQKGQLEANLMAPYLKQMTKAKSSIAQAGQTVTNTLGATDMADQGSVRGVSTSAGAKAAIATSRAQAGLDATSAKDKERMRQEKMSNSLINFKNILRQSMQTGAQESASTYQAQGLDQQRKIMQGQAVGEIFRMGGAMSFMNSRGA